MIPVRTWRGRGWWRPWRGEVTEGPAIVVRAWSEMAAHQKAARAWERRVRAAM